MKARHASNRAYSKASSRRLPVAPFSLCKSSQHRPNMPSPTPNLSVESTLGASLRVEQKTLAHSRLGEIPKG